MINFEIWNRRSSRFGQHDFDFGFEESTSSFVLTAMKERTYGKVERDDASYILR